MKDIRNTDEKDARLWNSIRIASIAAVMAGVAIAAYSAYGVATFNPADAFAGTGAYPEHRYSYRVAAAWRGREQR